MRLVVLFVVRFRQWVSHLRVQGENNMASRAQGKVITGNPPAMASPKGMESSPMKITVRPPAKAEPGDSQIEPSLPKQPSRKPWKPTGDGPPDGSTIGHLGAN
jgi:hypothetical protein